MTATDARGGSGRYHLESRIATGGMGEVWRATDTVLDREVAVKLLKHEYADDPTFRARFTAEAQHAAALHHPNIASVFDFGEIAEGDGSDRSRPFLVMELVPGQPLSNLLQSGQPMPPETATDLVAQAADAIAAAHTMGIVHRDVKPANLLVTPDGTVKITDFGIARAAGSGVAVTQTGQIIGTPHYISPEQAEGEEATPASDVYALGVVLYECLAGQRPFLRDTPIQVALAHVREEAPPLPSGVPERVRAIVSRALAKKPEERFASAADLATALRGGEVPGLGAAAAVVTTALPFAPTTQVLEQPPTTTPGAAGPDDRRRAPAWWPWVAAAAAVLLVVVATAVLADPGSDEGNTPADNPATGQDVGQRGQKDPARETRPESRPTDDDRVRVREGAYLGEKAGEVKKQLEDLGFDVEEEKVPASSYDQEKGTVAAVDPHGLVEPGTVLTMAVWEEYQPPEPPDDDDRPGKGKGRDKGGKEDKG